MRFQRTWGVEIIGVRLLSSGFNLQFSYRVVDAKRAKALNDKAATPYLIDEASGAKLSIPAPDKVGPLRTSPVPQNDRVYWMMFGNPGKFVKAGNRVSVVIGEFRVDGLIVH